MICSANLEGMMCLSPLCGKLQQFEMAQNMFLDHRHTVDVVSVDVTVYAVTKDQNEN